MWSGRFTELKASVFMGPVDSGIIETGIKTAQLNRSIILSGAYSLILTYDAKKLGELKRELYLSAVCNRSLSQASEKRLLASSNVCPSARPNGATLLPLDGFSRGVIFEFFFFGNL